MAVIVKKICQVQTSLSSRQVVFFLQGMVSKGTLPLFIHITMATATAQMQFTRTLCLRSDKKVEKIFAVHIRK